MKAAKYLNRIIRLQFYSYRDIGVILCSYQVSKLAQCTSNEIQTFINVQFLFSGNHDYHLGIYSVPKSFPFIKRILKNESNDHKGVIWQLIQTGFLNLWLRRIINRKNNWMRVRKLIWLFTWKCISFVVIFTVFCLYFFCFDCLFSFAFFLVKSLFCFVFVFLFLFYFLLSFLFLSYSQIIVTIQRNIKVRFFFY